MTSDEMVSKFASVSATALKNGTQVDESQLSSLAVAGLDMVEGATGMASAVQDQVTQEERVPVFNGMPDIVTGKKGYCGSDYRIAGFGSGRENGIKKKYGLIGLERRNNFSAPAFGFGFRLRFPEGEKGICDMKWKRRRYSCEKYFISI